METMGPDELRFFEAQRREGALPLYAALRRCVEAHCAPVRIEVKKTQISFVNRRLFAAASFLPARRAAERPETWLTVTFGLGRRLGDPRVDVAVEPYPGRWTHHVTIGGVEEVDGTLAAWLREAAAFSAAKR